MTLQNTTQHAEALQEQVDQQTEALRNAAQQLQTQANEVELYRKKLSCQTQQGADRLRTVQDLQKQVEKLIAVQQTTSDQTRSCMLQACVSWCNTPAVGEQLSQAARERNRRCGLVYRELANNSSWELDGVSGRPAGVLSSLFCLLGEQPLVVEVAKALLLQVTHPDKGGNALDERCLREMRCLILPDAA